MSFKEDIDKLIEKNLKTYTDSSDRFVADYNRELELTKEYNGRQLLELLQNADDAESNEVAIEIDKLKRILTISNTGTPFSSGGIKSLMLANLSTKTSISYVGNKGLGFRSILNWAESVNIFGNGCRVSFSETIAKTVFNTELGLSNEEKQHILKDRGLVKGTIPFPTLGIPVVKENIFDTKWTTVIEIKYLESFEDKIIEQLSSITEEILLFLNWVKKITITHADGEKITISSTKSEYPDFDLIEIKDKKWKVFSKEDSLPEQHQDKTKNEKQLYKLKVAFQDDLSDNYNKLFNFFPTELSISLPCIIHGTFELNSSRNHLNNLEKNNFILKKLVELFQKCATYLTNQQVDWRAYKLLTPKNEASDSTLIKTFYKNLEQAKNEIEIFPGINGNYIKQTEIIYYNDDFNSFFRTEFPSVLPSLILPLGTEIINKFQNREYDHEFLVEAIDNLSASKISNEIRAELIAQLALIIKFSEKKKRFLLLINEGNKVIKRDVLAFTPVLRSEFSIPESVKVDFMHQELYDILLRKFEADFDSKEPKPRELQRVIKSVVNIQPYDSNNVIDKIIVGTRNELKTLEDAELKIKCIKETVTALFANFKNINNQQDKLKETVPLINKEGQIEVAENLFLSKTFKYGVLIELIYENVLTDSDYLNDINFWNLQNEESNLIELFFSWLGVNKYSKIQKIDLCSNWTENKYFEFIFKNGEVKPLNFEISRVNKNNLVNKLDYFEKLIKLPINNLLLLILKDSVIKNQLETNDNTISWSYVRNQFTIYSKFSYIRYQFIKSGVFSKYVLEDGSDKLYKFMNEDVKIDYAFLEGYGYSKLAVNAILLQLGAKESFNDLSPNIVYEIIKSVEGKDPSKKGIATQSLYKMALDCLKNQKNEFSVPNNLVFFSKKGAIEAYQPANKIYYSDNAILPKRIMDSLFLINLPKRVGEVNVQKYFNVQSLSNFSIQITDKNYKVTELNVPFNQLFETIKPYLLAYRLFNTNLNKKINDKVKKQNEANQLKNCKINIVENCLYNFGEEVNIPIEEDEFINVKSNFYYRINSVISIEELRKDSIFCDAFAEMMCIVFKVNEFKNDFRQILKNELKDTIHLANQDFDKEEMNEVFELLGISKLELDFWDNIFKLKIKKLPDNLESKELLFSSIFQNLEINLPSNYGEIEFDRFNNSAGFQLIKTLVEDLKLTVQNVFSIGLFSWHQTNFNDAIKSNHHKFKHLLWLQCNKSQEGQEKYINILNEFNKTFIETIEQKIQIFKYEIDCNYSELIIKWIDEKYNIDLNDTFDDVVIKNNYVTILKKYSALENDITDLNIKSLLFFEGNNTLVENYLKSNTLINLEDTDEEKDNVEVGEIVFVSLKKNLKSVIPNASSGNNTPWNHSSQSDKLKRVIGKAAERLVYNSLVKKFGVNNVKWVSGSSNAPNKNDKLHYDIEYKNEEEIWKFLEVKAIMDNHFIISSSEKEKAIEVPEKYEFALVKDRKIHIVKNLFKFINGESFNDNSNFKAKPKDYFLTFDITKITII